MHIRRIDLADLRAVERVAAGHLTEAERRRADRGTGSVRHRRILLRAGLRQFLGELLDLSPARVPLVEEHGRPHLGAPLHELRISCSASGTVGLVAVAQGWPLGIDVELHREEEARTAGAEGWLHPAEERQLRQLAPSQQGRAATRCWTQKEAVLKGLGLGLHRHPRTVRTPLGETGRSEGWWLVPVPVAPDHLATAAVGTTIDRVDLFVEDMTIGQQ